MKRIWLALLFFPVLAYADAVSLSFKAIPVMNFAEATYKAMLGKDYMVSPDLIGLDKKVTINVKRIDREQLPPLLQEVLGSVGVRVREVSGIVRLEKGPPVGVASGDQILSAPLPSLDPHRTAQPDAESEDFELYRPRNRTVEYLQVALRSAGIANGQGSTGGAGDQQVQDAVVISGADAKRAKIRQLLEQLDQRPVVLNVRAALIEFTDSAEDALSFGAAVNILGGRLALALNSGEVASDNFARLKVGGLDAVFKAINGDSRFRFRTQPTLRLVDGAVGKLMVGSEVPVRGAMTLSKDGTPIQSIEYRSSGLALTVQPRAMDRRFTAKVIQEVSSFANTRTSNIDSPTLNKRQIEATVDAEDGEVVVLAGLDEETVSDGRSGPFSWLNLSRSFNSRKTQLLVLLEFRRL
ncbi:bacterial type II and III secretion system family protein [Burkholderia thailandensis E444]|uniref:type II secretion system protein GspD n=1 Tax=Burkholderia thailandensis TaxID=57975 RepID=UPI0003EC9198|nr:hypothetical protein [Burkholderia thailandensis]AHI80088.1 bacterial type II and III secretion system family protein [Burkholderia thailandensis E444]AWY68330.1 hypothetical protein A8H36_25700 [Burkholderia thailandensis]